MNINNNSFSRSLFRDALKSDQEISDPRAGGLYSEAPFTKIGSWKPIPPVVKTSKVHQETEPLPFGAKEIQQILQKTIGIHDQRIFEKLWNQALDAGRFSWISGQTLTFQGLEKIESALKETLVFHGKGIDAPFQGEDSEVHEIVRFLLGRGKAQKSWVNWKNIKGIFIKQDPQLLKAMQKEFQQVLQSCGSQLPVVGSPEEALFQSFVGNVVALLPYCYPAEGDLFSIPQKVDGEWRVVPYTLDRKIALSPKEFSSPLFALGFTSKEGPPLLSFLGTTFPAGEGFAATLFSDFTPGMSVGHAPYLYGKKSLQKWLQGKEGVRLYGMSLGGALTMQVLRHHEDKIGQVYAYNPAGLYPWDWKGKVSSEVNIYYQENDLVATLGFFPKGEHVHIFRVLGEKVENPLTAHTRVYLGGDRVTLLKSTPEYENSRFVRKLLTVLHLLLGPIIAFLPLLAAYLLYLILSVLVKLVILTIKQFCN